MARESPESQYETLKKQLQDSILREYPNPERKGCPGDAVLKKLAALPLDQSVELDPAWHHITHCSECYREFLALQPQFLRQSRTRRSLVTGAIVAGLAGVAGLLFVATQGSRPGKNGELAYVKTTVDIDSVTRSVEPDKPGHPIYLERKPLELSVQLPAGSKPGTYEFQLQKSNRPVVAATASAVIRDGTTAFTVRVDLEKLEAGQYSMSVRQVPWDWHYYPVIVR
jgi:hypothetical protein